MKPYIEIHLWFWDPCCISVGQIWNPPTPPLFKKGGKAFIILMKCCFQRNIDVLPSIAWLRKLCNAPFCKSKMQHEKYNTSALEQANFRWIFKNIRSLIAICILQQWKCKISSFTNRETCLTNLVQEVCRNFKEQK